MKRQSLLTQITPLLSKVPLVGWLIAGGVFAVVLCYSIIFFIPKTIHFSYAERTCVSHLSLAPHLQQAISEDFDIAFEDTVRIGDVAIASTKLCISPKKSLQAGSLQAYSAPFGGVVARKNFTIEVPKAPVARASELIGKTISTAEPLTIQLSSADVVHQYKLAIDEKTTACVQAVGELSCDIEPFELSHGATYTASLYQTYKEVKKKVVEGEIETLEPLVMTKAAVKNQQVVYDAPTALTFSFDQPLKGAEVTLEKVADETAEPVEVNQTLEGEALKLAFGTLDREATYQFKITQAIAESGSSLAEPIAITFKTSGGPKVSTTSVGSHSVARSASITVTLDQPLDKDVDITKFARVEGVAGSVRKQSDTQLVYTIKGGDCTAFTLVIDKGLKSGSNQEVSKDTWRFKSRTVCGYAWAIGKSVKGRSIVAYSFGSGSKTILFTGGIHGSEPSGTTTMQAWVKYLQAYAGDVIPAGKRVVIVPNTNPDGIAAGSRYNANNVNLGRNFPTANWSASIETSTGVHPKGGGTAPGSEPEAAALIKLVRQLKPRLAISYHAQGRLVGANKFADSVKIGDIYANTVGYRTMYYNAEAVMGYAMTGEMEDWMGEELSIPAILIELPSPSGNYLSSQLTALKKMLAV